MTPTQQTIDTLNNFLKHELTAVETYKHALRRVKDNGAQRQLEECERSHEQRVSVLKSKIQELGGNPAHTVGAWGTFAKLVERGAAAFGDRMAVAALEEGEDRGTRDYKEDLTKLDPNVRAFVEREILPAQEKTFGAMNALKRTIH